MQEEPEDVCSVDVNDERIADVTDITEDAVEEDAENGLLVFNVDLGNRDSSSNESAESRYKMSDEESKDRSGDRNNQPLSYELHILQEGYSYTEGEGSQRADGTITLLKHVKRSQHIIVDLGLPQDEKIIRDGLSQNGLTCADIDVVICTHGHSDHVGNLNLFSKATCIVGYDICKGDRYTQHTFFTQQHPYQYSVEDKRAPYVINEDVVVLPTPGHEMSHVSVLVKNVVHYGTVLLAGDLFECEADIAEPHRWQQNSCNLPLQSESRYYSITYDMENVLRHVLPGHGPIFPLTAEHVRRICTQNKEMQEEVVASHAERVDALKGQVAEVGEMAKNMEHLLQQMDFRMKSLIRSTAARGDVAVEGEAGEPEEQ